MWHLPERALQSLSLIPFDLSHLKKSSSDMELLNIKVCVAEGTPGGALRWSVRGYQSTNLTLSCHQINA